MQPGSWASALKKNLQSQTATTGQTTRDAANANLTSIQHVIPAVADKQAQPATGGDQVNSKAAAREKLLREALKSRANAVTGERHCLGCGRAFHDLSRFAQHILDKHSGINSAEPSVAAAAPSYQNNNTSGGGCGGAFPSLILTTEISKTLKLGDVAVIKTSSGAAVAKPERTTKLNQKTIAATTTATAATAAANVSSSHPRRKPDPTAFQAPEGTRAKRKKRPSRLKRMYRRTKAEAAVEHWLSVLSAIEEALQIVGELHGAITNELDALQHKENEAFVAARTQEEEKSKNISFARALLVGTAATEERKNTVFAPSAQLQVLYEQARETSERVEQLASIHATARANLMKSQEHLLSAQGGNGGRKGKLATTLLTIDALEVKPSKDALVIEQPEVKEEASLPEDLPPPQTSPTPSPVDALPPPPGPSPALSSAKHSADDLQQNGTQDVEIVGAQNENLENSSSTSNSSSSTSSSDGSSSSSSSGSDFGLQWGDTLRTWATHVGVDAKQSLQKQQQKRHHVQKQAKTKNEQLVEKKKTEPVVPAPAPVAVATNTQKTTNKLDKAVSVPLPSSALPAIAPAAPPPLAEVEATPPSSSIDAVRSWLQEAESVDVPEATSYFSHSSDSSDEINAVNEQQADHTMPLVVTATATTINPAAASPPFHCSICNITASGLKPWEDHLASRRHASQVAKTANTATVGPQKPSAVVPRVHQSAGSSKCYTGPNADVEPYVTHIITPELNEATTALLKQLLEWQERTRRLDPVNFKRKRRLISGMREVEKSVKLNKAKLLIVAPNIGHVPAASVAKINDDNKEDEADEKNKESTTLLTCYPIQSALDMAKERGIPTVFALTRQRMGKILGARKTASAFVVLDASGAEQLLAKVLELAR